MLYNNNCPKLLVTKYAGKWYINVYFQLEYLCKIMKVFKCCYNLRIKFTCCVYLNYK